MQKAMCIREGGGLSESVICIRKDRMLQMHGLLHEGRRMPESGGLTE